MDVVEVQQTGARDPGPGRPSPSRWAIPALAGAAVFWLANLAISLTPVAAEYRSALSIPYVPMLLEAAGGGLVVAAAVALPLTRFPDRVPGHGPLGKALVLGGGAVVVLTVLVEVPSKLRSGVADPGHWLLVATGLNAIRVLALGVAIGLATRARTTRHDRHHPVARREAHS